MLNLPLKAWATYCVYKVVSKEEVPRRSYATLAWSLTLPAT